MSEKRVTARELSSEYKKAFKSIEEAKKANDDPDWKPFMDLLEEVYNKGYKHARTSWKREIMKLLQNPY